MRSIRLSLTAYFLALLCVLSALQASVLSWMVP